MAAVPGRLEARPRLHSFGRLGQKLPQHDGQAEGVRDPQTLLPEGRGQAQHRLGVRPVHIGDREIRWKRDTPGRPCVYRNIHAHDVCAREVGGTPHVRLRECGDSQNSAPQAGGNCKPYRSNPTRNHKR